MEPESSLFSRRGGIEERFHSPETTGNPPAFPERLSLHFRAKGKVGKGKKTAMVTKSILISTPPLLIYDLFGCIKWNRKIHFPKSAVVHVSCRYI
jgi:hypothetical protein